MSGHVRGEWGRAVVLGGGRPNSSGMESRAGRTRGAFKKSTIRRDYAWLVVACLITFSCGRGPATEHGFAVNLPSAFVRRGGNFAVCSFVCYWPANAAR